jgi:hypothetical protein
MNLEGTQNNRATKENQLRMKLNTNQTSTKETSAINLKNIKK